MVKSGVSNLRNERNTKMTDIKIGQICSDEYTATEQIQVASHTLTSVLDKMLGANIIPASYQCAQLYGGTLGDVHLISGIALSTDGEKLP